MIFRSTRQGFPTATTPAGMSFVTTEPAPMTASSPMVTPGRIVTFAPIQTRFPIAMGLLSVSLMTLGRNLVWAG